MFGKIMSLKDEFIIKYFILLTRVDLKIINEYKVSLENGINPRDIKMKLAHQIVVMYHNHESANLAQSNWEKTFSDKKIPDVIQTIKVNKGLMLIDVLISYNLVKSKTDARRLFNEGAIKNLNDGSKINDSQIKITEPLVLKIGKKTFLKIDF
jgi:tyrosyl-tRNA synthetase